MLFKKHKIDERVRSSVGQAAAVWLGTTQILLAGVIFFRLYVSGQPDQEIRDFQAVLAVSLFGHMALQLFLGGILPVPTKKGLIVSYLVIAGLITGVCLLVYGVPALGEWRNPWLPALSGPALLVGFYWLLAWLGRWRVERLIRE